LLPAQFRRLQCHLWNLGGGDWTDDVDLDIHGNSHRRSRDKRGDGTSDSPRFDGWRTEAARREGRRRCRHAWAYFRRSLVMTATLSIDRQIAGLLDLWCGWSDSNRLSVTRNGF